ncbi:MAG TPA: hypothetical protein VF121_19115 [Thermoanaerobaculia bacterium]|nr:hypothetical protein [Thermoanaerobaculia bacterium]
MLEARPISFFSQDFGIEAGGQQIALLDVSCWKEAGEISIQGQPYRLYRERLMSGAFVLEGEGQPVARAIKPSPFRSQFDLELDSDRYTLQRDSAFGRSFSVFQDRAVVGSIRPAGAFTRRSILDLPSDWSIPIQVFAFWLVLVIWNRDGAAAAAAGAGG